MAAVERRPNHQVFVSEPHQNEPPEETITYPEGGVAAWMVALGSWCSMTAGLGMVNSVGVLEAYVSTNILTSSSTNTTGWIFGIYVFVSYFCGIQIGPIFDARGPRELMLTGSVLLLIGTFTLGLCREYYQFILAFSILSGIGNSFLFTPAMGAISHWFNKRRGEASGFAFTGSGFGGVLFPLMMQSLLPRVGFAWSARIVGFVFLLLCALSVALCRSRLPRKMNNGAGMRWQDILPDMRIFKDGTGAMAVTTAGVFLIEWAYFIPVTYIPSYYLVREGLSDSEAISGAAAFAYQLLAIMNAVSCVGRYFIGYIADRTGRYNTIIVFTLICLMSVMGLWLPDALAPSDKSLLIMFVVVFGFASGSNISLMPVCIGQLCATEDYGRYYATAYTVASIGCLTGIPIAGNLIAATASAGGRRGYWGVILFTGLSYVLALACFLWVRIRVKGWNIRTVW